MGNLAAAHLAKIWHRCIACCAKLSSLSRFIKSHDSGFYCKIYLRWLEGCKRFPAKNSAMESKLDLVCCCFSYSNFIGSSAGYADELINQQSFTMKEFSTNNEFPQFGLIGYFLLNFFTFGIGEETGWRGYALPTLQKRFSALTATLILAVGWVCWHIPAFIYRPLCSQMDVVGIASFFMCLLMGAVVLTWLYNSTRGSLFIAALFHTMIELIFISANIKVKMSSYVGVAITVAAILIIMLAKLRNLSLQPKQTE